METTEKINVRGAINALEVGAPPLELPRCCYMPSRIRVTASTIAGDTGKTFTVSTTEDLITVTRLS